MGNELLTFGAQGAWPTLADVWQTSATGAAAVSLAEPRGGAATDALRFNSPTQPADDEWSGFWAGIGRTLQDAASVVTATELARYQQQRLTPEQARAINTGQPMPAQQAPNSARNVLMIGAGLAVLVGVAYLATKH